MTESDPDRITEDFDDQVDDDEMSPEEAGFAQGERDARTRRNADEDEVV